MDEISTEEDGARSYVRLGLMQTNLDADGWQIENLDTSNLVIPGIPSQTAPAHKWFNSYDVGTHTFGSSQPSFPDITGTLTAGPQGQQRAITELGTIRVGSWHGSALEAVFVPRLNEIQQPADDVYLNNKKITNLADPVDPQDAVNLRLLQQISARNPKAAAVAVSTSNIAPSTLAHPVDGVTLLDGNRVLLIGQSAAYQNGLWVAHSGAWTRPDDFDGSIDDPELLGATVFVLGGTLYAGSTWFQSRIVSPVYIYGPDPLDDRYPHFVIISTSLDISAGAGLRKIGQTISAVGTTNRISIGAGIDIASNYVGQSSINTLGTITTGIWGGHVISGEFGGTGVNNAATITLCGNFLSTLDTLAPPGSTLEFIVAGSTHLRLPVTGTLATTGGNETFTNKHISASQIDSGILSITQGGTGAVNAKVAMQNLLPSQSGHAGHVLSTDGAGNLSWIPN